MAKVAPPYLKCSLAKKCVRAGEILTFRDQLNILAFAYFPLKSPASISYTTYSLKHRDKLTTKSQVTVKQLSTADPVEVLLYYASAMYTAEGDVGDAKLHGGVLLTLLKQMSKSLTKEVAKVYGADLAPGLSWAKYLANPGPQAWTIAAPPGVSSKNALYLGRPKESSQFWGKVKPVQGSSFLSGLSQLVQSQVDEALARHADLIKTNPQGDWTSGNTILESDNIDTYHKLRKSIRSLVKTVLKYPQVLSGLEVLVPAAVIDFSNINMGTSLPKGKLVYSDLFCLGSTLPKCQVPVGLSRLLFIGDTGKFPALWWGLSPRSLAGLRAMFLLYWTKLGTKSNSDFTGYARGLVGCPSVQQPADAQPVDFQAPQVTVNPLAMTGTMCELVDYFGDIHDVMVEIQQGKGTGGERAFVTQTVAGLKQFMDTIDFDGMLKNLGSALC